MAEKPKHCYFDGRFVPVEDAKVSVLTHGLNYGTGCFEGIRGYWNATRNEMFVVKMREHFERLHRSAKILFCKVDESVDRLCDLTIDLVRKNEFREDIYIRPLLFVSDERIGVRLHDVSTTFTMFAVPMGDYIKTSGISAGVSSWRRIEDNAVPARAKITGAYINSALAKTEAVQRGFDEAIFLNSDGHVSEGSAMNLFIVRDGKLATPAVNHNILEGVTRGSVISLARDELRLTAIERTIDRTELYIADEVFLCGTGAQIAPVVTIDNREVGNGKVGPVTRELMDLYNQAVRGENEKFLDWVSPVYKKKMKLPSMPAPGPSNPPDEAIA